MIVKELNPFSNYTDPLEAKEGIQRINELETLIKQSEQYSNTCLIAPRRYGKTTLINDLIFELDKIGIPSVRINFYGVKTFDDLSRRITKAYYTQLSGKTQRNAKHILNSIQGVSLGVNIDVNGNLGVTSGVDFNTKYEQYFYDVLELPKKLFDKTGVQIQVIFDEFQDVIKIDKDIDKKIRSVIEYHGKGVSYLFAGSEPSMMDDLFTLKNKAFYKQAKIIKLNTFDDLDVSNYIEDKFNKTNRKISDEVINLFTAFVRGHARSINFVASYLWELTKRNETAELDEWNETLEQIYKSSNSLDSFWNNLNSNQQSTYYAIAKYTNEMNTKKVYESLNIKRSTLNNIKRQLLKDGECIIDDNNMIKLTDPIDEMWILKNWQNINN